MQWDDYDCLHAYIDAVSGGFGTVDMVGYGGQWGRYTIIETYTNPNIGTVAAGTYLSTEGPGGAVYYKPKSGVALARLHADDANEYADTMDDNRRCGYNAASGHWCCASYAAHAPFANVSV